MVWHPAWMTSNNGILKRILEKARDLLGTESTPEAKGPDRDLALAVLLLQSADADHDLDPSEYRRSITELRRAFNLSEADAQALLDEARLESEAAVSLHDYVGRLREDRSPEQRLAVVAALWRVVAADGEIDPHEAHLVKRLGNLLGVPPSAVLQARHRAEP